MSDIMRRVVSRIKSVVGKALIESVSDSNDIQLVKISGLADEVQSNIERVQDYGITSNPPVESEAVVLYINGGKDHGIVIKTDSSEYRVQGLASGEVCIYSQFGQKILLDENGDIVFNDGTDFAVAFNELKTGFDNLKSYVNNLVLPVSTGGTAGPPVSPSTASIDASKIDGIKLP